MALGGGLQAGRRSGKTRRMEVLEILARTCTDEHRPTMYPGKCKICGDLVNSSNGHLWRCRKTSDWVCACTECHQIAKKMIKGGSKKPQNTRKWPGEDKIKFNKYSDVFPNPASDINDSTGCYTQNMGVPKAVQSKPKSLREELQAELDGLIGSKAASTPAPSKTLQNAELEKARAQLEINMLEAQMSILRGGY